MALFELQSWHLPGTAEYNHRIVQDFKEMLRVCMSEVLLHDPGFHLCFQWLFSDTVSAWEVIACFDINVAEV